ncbi:MAG: hypothetical protein E6H78_06355 [Betaproteobacteria bacterium]|nr:MAG: hypothetical protein E6H78_06355 [Betaproteobacteria bacterium]
MTGANSSDVDAAQALRLSVTAHALATARAFEALSTGFTLTAAAALAVAAVVGVASVVAVVAFALCLVVGLAAKWTALRACFDARLLAMLATDAGSGTPSTGVFDSVMLELQLLPPAKAGRDWLLRCRRALRLPLWLGALVTLQALLIAAAGCSVLLD